MRAYRRLLGVCLCVALGAVVIVGCGKQPIAVVGQHKVTRDEFLDKLEKDQGRNALINMINERLLEDAFTASGESVTPEDVQERIKELKERAPSPEAFAEALAQQSMTEQDLVEQMTKTMKLEALCTKDVKVTDEGLKAFFEEHKERFSRPATISCSEIVVLEESEAQKIAQQLQGGGADFASLAKQHSISQMSRERGGKLPDLPAEHIPHPPAVKDALLTLEVGKVSDPISAEGRWYIVKLDGKEAEQKPDLKRDRKEIEEMFRLTEAKQPTELLAEIREKAVVNIVDPKYADLNDMFRPEPELPDFGTKAPPAGAEPVTEEAKPTGGQPAAGGE